MSGFSLLNRVRDSRPSNERLPWLELADLAPPPVSALLHGGRSSLARGDHYNAQLAFEEALRVAPSAAAPYACLAELHYTQGDFDVAVDYLRKASTLAPETGALRTVLFAVLNLKERERNECDPFPTPKYLEVAPVSWLPETAVTRVQNMASLAAATAHSDVPEADEPAPSAPVLPRGRTRKRAPWVAAAISCAMIVAVAAGTFVLSEVVQRRRVVAGRLLEALELSALRGHSAVEATALAREARALGASAAQLEEAQRIDTLARQVADGMDQAVLAASADAAHLAGSSAGLNYARAELSRRAGIDGAEHQLAELADHDPSLLPPRLSLLLTRAVLAPERAAIMATQLSAAFPEDERVAALKTLLAEAGPRPVRRDTTSVTAPPMQSFLRELTAGATEQEPAASARHLQAAAKVELRDPAALGLLTLVASSRAQLALTHEVSDRLRRGTPRPAYLASLARRLISGGDGLTALLLLPTDCAAAAAPVELIVRAALLANDHRTLKSCLPLLQAPRHDPEAPSRDSSAKMLDRALVEQELVGKSELFEEAIDRLLEQSASLPPASNTARGLELRTNVRLGIQAAPSHESLSSLDEILADAEQAVAHDDGIEAARLLTSPELERFPAEHAALAGDLEMLRGHAEQAERAWSAALAAQPARVELRIKLARLHLDLEQFARADAELASLEDELSAWPDCAFLPEIGLSRVEALIGMGYYSRAVSTLEQLRGRAAGTRLLELQASLALTQSPKAALALTSKTPSRSARLDALRGTAELKLGLAHRATFSFAHALQRCSGVNCAGIRARLAESLLAAGQPLAAHYTVETLLRPGEAERLPTSVLARAALVDGKALLQVVPPQAAAASVLLTRAEQAGADPEATFWRGFALNIAGAPLADQRRAWQLYLDLQPKGALAQRCRQLLRRAGAVATASR